MGRSSEWIFLPTGILQVSKKNRLDFFVPVSVVGSLEIEAMYSIKIEARIRHGSTHIYTVYIGAPAYLKVLNSQRFKVWLRFYGLGWLILQLKTSRNIIFQFDGNSVEFSSICGECRMQCPTSWSPTTLQNPSIPTSQHIIKFHQKITHCTLTVRNPLKVLKYYNHAIWSIHSSNRTVADSSAAIHDIFWNCTLPTYSSNCRQFLCLTQDPISCVEIGCIWKAGIDIWIAIERL